MMLTRTRRSLPCTRSESRRVQEENSTYLEFFERIQQEAVEELRAISDLQTDSSSDDETFDQRRHLTNLVRVLEEDIMYDPYPK